MTKETERTGPLTGIRVIELSDRIGQWSGKLLADLGADVIKVEPLGGVPERQVGPFYKDLPHPDRSLYFWHYNTSKRGVTVNLMDERGRELFRELLAGADVLLESMPPGWLASVGLTFDSLMASNDRLVICSLTPFGQGGPWRDYRSTDLLHLAAGGQMAGCGYDLTDDPDQQPIAPGGGNAWHTGAHYASIATLAALFYRNVTGSGQYLDCAVHDACALTTEGQVNTWIYTKQVVRRQTGRGAAPWETQLTQLPTGDGGQVCTPALMLLMTPSRMRSLVAWMDEYGWASELADPRFLDPEVLADPQVRETISWQVRAFISSLSTEEVFEGAQRAGLPWGAIRATDETLGDPHFQARGFFHELHHSELGESYVYPGAAAIYSQSPVGPYSRAPLLGEHNTEVYGELGLGPERIAELRSQRVI